MTKKLVKLIPLTILIIGILTRLIYCYSFGYQDYQHDSESHKLYIQFIADNLNLPRVDKGLEYPQQPFYYIIAGIIYRFLNNFSVAKDSIFKSLVWISTFSSIGTLIFTYFLTQKITKKTWVQSFVIGLMAFTPAFLYQAGMISNDPLLVFFASGAFFFLINFTENNQTKNIVLAIICASLAAFTKISGGILFFIILLFLFYKLNTKCHSKKLYLRLIIITFLSGLLCLGLFLYRAYLPDVGKFRFIESYAWKGQETNPTDLSYFFKFNFVKFLKVGESYVFGDENIAKTFPTFLYGSFLFGEYSYKNISDTYPFIKILMQLIILLGLLFPLGIIVNFFFIGKWSPIDYMPSFGVIINLILIIFLIYKYPSVCNSDFRYFSPIFLGLLSLSSNGLSRLNEKIRIKYIIPSLCLTLILSELIWITIIIIIRISTNI
jgi:hypothetical protein